MKSCVTLVQIIQNDEYTAYFHTDSQVYSTALLLLSGIHNSSKLLKIILHIEDEDNSKKYYKTQMLAVNNRKWIVTGEKKF